MPEKGDIVFNRNNKRLGTVVVVEEYSAGPVAFVMDDGGGVMWYGVEVLRTLDEAVQVARRALDSLIEEANGGP